MATIRKISGKLGDTYNVQIRIRPYGNITRTFKKLKKAKIWVAQIEVEIREGRYGIISEARKKTLNVAIERYCKYVLPSVKKSRREHIIDWWQKMLGNLPLKDITPSLVAEIRDKLLHEVVDKKKKSSATVVKYLATLSHILTITLSHILTICVNEWQWLETNPVMKVTKLSLPKGRTRFLDDEGGFLSRELTLSGVFELIGTSTFCSNSFQNFKGDCFSEPMD